MEHFTLLNKCCLLIAKRNSGKSELLKYLVKIEQSEFNKIFVICPTERINHFYQNAGICASDCIFDNYNENWAEQLIQKMTEMNANKKQEDRKNVLLILDDCIADTVFHQSPTLKKILTRGRHINLSLCITTQLLTGVPPIARNNSDYIFTGQLNKASVDLLCDEFQAGNIERKEFLNMYIRCTKDYNFLVINNNSVKDNDLNSLYGKIKTPIKYLN